MEGFSTFRMPEFIIFTGPMFGSKTSRLIASVDRFRYQNRKVMAFKPQIDQRYSESAIVTHNGANIPATVVKTGEDIIKEIKKSEIDPNVVAIDEAFMIEGAAEATLKLFKEGKTILISSLQISASGNVFTEVRDMMPWATKIEICPAVCTVTGADAFYTHKKFENLAEIAVGGSELYEPRCWLHHPFMNQMENEVPK
tara:strand:- start:10229 stop:10822 length:594 start_codon:yes stop_codon:yes gene_type:complete